MLSWKVYLKALNATKIIVYDVFADGYYEQKAKEYKATTSSKEEFSEAFRVCLMSQFWSRYEYEMILTSWPPYISAKELEGLNQEAKNFEETYGHKPFNLEVPLNVRKKIDVFEQLALNWEQFIDYVWRNVGGD